MEDQEGISTGRGVSAGFDFQGQVLYCLGQIQADIKHIKEAEIIRKQLDEKINSRIENLENFRIKLEARAGIIGAIGGLIASLVIKPILHFLGIGSS